MMFPKENAIECEAYRRLVALLPCKNCGLSDYSQAAHVPPDGKAIKRDDRLTFPLCATRFMRTGCHVEFDQYRLFPHDKAVEVGMQWARETRQRIAAMGLWPKKLPKWPENIEEGAVS